MRLRFSFKSIVSLPHQVHKRGEVIIHMKNVAAAIVPASGHGKQTHLVMLLMCMASKDSNRPKSPRKAKCPRLRFATLEFHGNQIYAAFDGVIRSECSTRSSSLGGTRSGRSSVAEDFDSPQVRHRHNQARSSSSGPACEQPFCFSTRSSLP